MTVAGIQASSLRPYLQTEADLRASFQKLRAMGCRYVQLQWHSPALAPSVIADALAQAGLQATSTQDLYSAVLDDLPRTVALNRLCGGTCVCVSGIPAPALTAQSVRAFGADLSALAARLAAQGLTLAFHPRAREFAALEQGTATDLLLACAPAVRLGLDLYHAVKAGLAPEALLRRYAGRVEFVHFKDFCPTADGGELLVPPGQGCVDWAPAIAACLETGVPWAFVEQERWEKDAFACMAEGLAFLQKNGIEP